MDPHASPILDSRAHMETHSTIAPATSSSSTLAPALITRTYDANFRWGAPEVLLGEMCRTPASDIFSLGRLMVELLTGDIPFSGLTDGAIIERIVAGQYDRPTDSHAIACGLDDNMWALALECWNRDPLERPSVSQVLESLRRMSEPLSMKERT
ncbi:hypothetical protein BOTBODRAFT_564093 [Botryobasidium botryosum FD-172 SS1]|uniref:Protein kinase domain-containing protein n=1 Tax=Botryobasidium botryosum (strain FD-172 SS1) TaxID=930990 RepID=A0A067MAB8_BOTB1|nr:hypothetical protein BOTBODRAFT_564093 [Botryobasidium botryosum FD-172 SS1]